MSRNVETVRAIHDAFNRRDWDAMIAPVTDDFTTTEGDGTVYRGRAGAIESAKVWADAFSDGRITEATYYDAGDTVITEFVGRGTHDGPLGPIPATGKTTALPYLEIYHFNKQGQCTSMRAYFNQLTLMQELGLADVPQQSTITLETPAATRT
jgi:steroid delta-isomerase-like uncharacterized protein